MKRQTVLRLVSLMLLAVTMNQPTYALDWLRNFLNHYYNDEQYGQRCYSQASVQTGIGEGKVYMEWATGRDYSADYLNEHFVTEITVSSPSDYSAYKARSAEYKDHKYILFATGGEDGWEFENVYTDADFQFVYTPQDAKTQDGIYAGQVVVRTYATTAANQPVVNLFARFALNVNINARGYSTLYYSNYNFKVPTGVTATTYKLGSGNGQLDVSKTYAAGAVIPAGEAVVLQGSPSTTYKFVPVKGTYTKDSGNILRGTDVAETTTGGAKYYALSYNSTKGVVGFYWMNPNGAAFTNGAHKAYLALGAGAADVRGFDLTGDDATGISDVDANVDANGAIYNLAGQRINKMQRGINIVNGKKILK